MSKSYDCIIIGAGPGGYVAAIRAAQLGLQTAIIEKRQRDKKVRLGGTCLNVGCIPSKALLDSSEHYYNARHAFGEHGIVFDKQPKLDLKTMMQRKQQVVDNLTGGVAHLLRKHKVDVYTGLGSLDGKDQGVHRLRIALTSGDDQQITAQHIILATGSQPIEIKQVPFEDERVISSTEALSLKRIPKRLVIVGGGIIGLELGSVWSRLGSAVTVIEALDRIATGFERSHTEQLQKILSKQGIEFRLSCSVTGLGSNKKELTVHARDADDQEHQFQADNVLVAVGRRPCTSGLGLDAHDIATDDRGRIQVDEHYQTTQAGIYAIGDLVAGPMLAHKAEEEGMAVAELLAGEPGHVDLNLIPNVLYTWPELASVGRSSEQLKADGVTFRSGRFSFQANGRAQAAGDTDGQALVHAEQDSGRLLGVSILGPRASDLIAEACSVMAFGGTAEDIALTCHAHPTFSESLREAALDSLGRVIHS